MNVFSKLTIALTLSTFMATGALASLQNSNNDDPKKVTFLQPAQLADFAMRGVEVPENFLPHNYFEASIHTGMLLTDFLNADGVGAGVIVIDRSFAPDAALDLQIYEDLDMPKNLSKVPHGSVVASLIASKTNVVPKVLATGAKIYPILTQCKQERENKDQLKLMLRELEAQEKDINSRFEQNILQHTGDDASTNLNRGVELLRLQGQHFSDLKKNHAEQLYLRQAILDLIKPVISISTLDRLQLTLNECRANGVSLPRVICMSLPCTVGEKVELERFQRLTKILEDNDLLLVLAAGNTGQDGKAFVLGQDKIDAPECFVDLMNRLNNYPELINRMLFVSATGKNDKIASYSSQAGSMKDHTVIADGNVFNVKTYNEDGSERHVGAPFCHGTSFAAPRVAALAVVLGKYFPKLTMQQIKQIILKTAFKQEGHKNEVEGQGAIYPMAAWNQAVLEYADMEKAAKPSFLAKLKNLFSKK
ncbi:MAG: S8 family serine peptidase [Alphaproteobacteria bacterium]|nr:S8 family serine peptidase [Alphaproteobacteria bacterium]